MRAPFTKTKLEMKRNGCHWHYYMDEVQTWPLSKWRDYFCTFLPYKLKWWIKDLIRNIEWAIKGRPF